ncbi:GntR family transcriptional regulator [Georgenia sp. SUBG003]|uniref:GntR family transcriptional regulator n=1 Tax=Georgenia sp. SUBG003 TaxID=1497974 RepID=UPI003AB3DCC8
MSTEPVALPPLRALNLRDQALAAVREAIVMGNMPPGTHLAETRLAQDLGISRGTLREAMRQLQQEGLAVTDGRGRLYVRSLDGRTIRDTFIVRAALESLAARTVAGLPEPERTEALSRLNDALAELRSAESESLPASIEADLTFHRTLCEVSGNVPLLQTWTHLENVLRMSIMNAGAERARTNMSADRHTEVIELIAANSPDLEARMRSHILAVLGDFDLQVAE